MYHAELYTLQSELDYRRERMVSGRTHRRRERRDPYLPWLLRNSGRRTL